MPLNDGDSPFELIVLGREHIVSSVRATNIDLQRSHLDQFVAMVETRWQDVENGHTRFYELFKSFSEEGCTVNGREKDGLYLIVAKFKGRLMSQD